MVSPKRSNTSAIRFSAFEGKAINKSKLGFEDIRNAKNGFVNDELKYGAKETEDVVEENDTKSDELNK